MLLLLRVFKFLFFYLFLYYIDLVWIINIPILWHFMVTCKLHNFEIIKAAMPKFIYLNSMTLAVNYFLEYRHIIDQQNCFG